MKKIVRLTESDLMRIVKRVIREQEWSDEDESELSSAESKYKDIQSRMMDKSKSIHSKYPPSNDNEFSDEFYDEIGAMYDDPDYIETVKKRDDLSRKKGDYKEKMRYGDVVKNRPSDFDVERYSSEYEKLGPEIGNLKKGYPYLKDEPDFDTFADKYEKYDKSDKGMSLKSKQDRRDYLTKNLDRDYRKNRK
jgi:hypothetical protein